MAEDKHQKERQRQLARRYGGADYRAYRREADMAGVKRQSEVSSGAHRARTEESLVMGGFAIVLVIGGALLVLILGTGPATLGIGVIVLVFGIFLLLYKGLGLLEAWLKRGDD
jgi:1,4-dihydroxy-2-naphthoate octaprenyltransferase